jgi:putative membrane protein
MKNFIILLNIAIILWVTSIFSVDRSGENTNTENQVQSKAHLVAGIGIDSKKADHSPGKSKVPTNPVLDPEVSDFVREVSEARIMDIEQGKIAQQRGTSRTVKDYGTLMVNDQTKMLEDLRKIAVKKGLTMATSLGEDKSSGLRLRDLKDEHGKDFDDKFTKMMAIDHKRDVKIFEEAVLSTDPDIQVFATKYLPLVKSHLDKIKSIRKN